MWTSTPAGLGIKYLPSWALWGLIWTVALAGRGVEYLSWSTDRDRWTTFALASVLIKPLIRGASRDSGASTFAGMGIEYLWVGTALWCTWWTLTLAGGGVEDLGRRATHCVWTSTRAYQCIKALGSRATEGAWAAALTLGLIKYLFSWTLPRSSGTLALT